MCKKMSVAEVKKSITFWAGIAEDKSLLDKSTLEFVLEWIDEHAKENKEKGKADTRPVHIRQETHQQLKDFCWEKGGKMYALADNVLTKYLDGKLVEISEEE